MTEDTCWGNPNVGLLEEGPPPTWGPFVDAEQGESLSLLDRDSELHTSFIANEEKVCTGVHGFEGHPSSS